MSIFVYFTGKNNSVVRDACLHGSTKRSDCCRRQPVFMALSDFADILLTFL